MKIDKIAVGQRLERLRKSKNLTLADVAEKIGVRGKTTVNAWEKGRSYPKKNIKQLAKLYNSTVDYINYGSLEKYVKEIIINSIYGERTILSQPLLDYFNTFYDYSNIEESLIINESSQEQIDNFLKDCLDDFLDKNINKIMRDIDCYDEGVIEEHIGMYVTFATEERKLEFWTSSGLLIDMVQKFSIRNFDLYTDKIDKIDVAYKKKLKSLSDKFLNDISDLRVQYLEEKDKKENS